jgi:subtilisin family serine protease
MKECVIVAKSEADIDSLHAELVANGTEVADLVPLNELMYHYMLSDEEAAKLAHDPRVAHIHYKLPASAARPHVVQDVTETPHAYNSTAGNFARRATNPDVYNVNWGLRRATLNTTEATAGATYAANRDGTGVDIVIMDDGVQSGHPEFGSRLKEIDWYQAAGVAGTMPTGFYDYSIYGEGEHGTHVAGIAAGTTYGAAKGANIYSLRIFDNTTSGPSKSFDPYTAFDILRAWHAKKFAQGGSRRPTIVNMSWGYVWYYSENPNRLSQKVINKIVYEGVTTNYASYTQYLPNKGMVGPQHCVIDPATETRIAQGQAAGIVYVTAAGNYGHKVDVSGGTDYNNYYTLPFSGAIAPANTPIYYHRGGSPGGTIRVSASDSATIRSGNNYQEQLAYYSERGPGCDVVSPGTDITSSTSNQSSFTPFPYVFGTQQQSAVFKACKIAGTSMATPNVTGVCALYMQANPTATPGQVKTWLTSQAKTNQLYNSTTSTNAWSNNTALLGAPNRFLYNPYHGGYSGA